MLAYSTTVTAAYVGVFKIILSHKHQIFIQSNMMTKKTLAKLKKICFLLFFLMNFLKWVFTVSHKILFSSLDHLTL